jgi:hypothetical protein
MLENRFDELGKIDAISQWVSSDIQYNAKNIFKVPHSLRRSILPFERQNTFILSWRELRHLRLKLPQMQRMANRWRKSRQWISALTVKHSSSTNSEA